MSLLPSRPDTSPPDDAEPRVIDVESDDAEAVIAALSSETARTLLNELYDEPAPASTLANRADTSVQNARYHLDKLESAGAITVVDTAYSEKGREMDVYAPADQPLVIYAGDEHNRGTLRTALSRLLGSLGILAVGSAAVQAIYGESLIPWGEDDAVDDPAPPADDEPEEPVADDPDDEVDEPVTDEPDDESPDEDEEADIGIAEEPEEEPDEPTDEPDEVDAEDAEFDVDTTVNVSEDSVNVTDAPTNGLEETQTVAEAATTLPPGVLFFAGGLLVLCVVAVLYYLHVRRSVPGQTLG